MTDDDPVQVQRASAEEQIAAILGPNIFRWAASRLPKGVSLDDVRFRDLISVTENDVRAHVTHHGFDSRVVAEDAVMDDRICIVHSGASWRVFYTERGKASAEAQFESKDSASADVVRRLMRLARINLNSRYWHAHGLPYPCDDE